MKPMNLKQITAMWILLALIAAMPLAAHPSLRLVVGGGAFFSAYAKFKDLYGPSQFMPRVGLDLAISPKLALWADGGFFSADGVIPELDEEITINQVHLGLGLAYTLLQSGKTSLAARAGLAWYSYSEEALEKKISDSALGVSLGLGADYAFTQRFFLRLGLDYRLINLSQDDLTMKLGGLQACAGLGISF